MVEWWIDLTAPFWQNKDEVINMARKSKIAAVPLGHEVYFRQFPTLFDELKQKAGEIVSLMDDSTDVFITDYVSNIDEAYQVVQELKKQDVDGVFMLLTTYLPSMLASPFALYLDVPQVLVAVQPLDALDYERCTTYMQLANDDVCAMPEIAGVYLRLGRKMPPCIVAASSQTEKLKTELHKWQHAISAKGAFKYAIFGHMGHTYEGMYDMHTDPTAFSAAFGAHVRMIEMCELARYADEVTREQLAAKQDLIRQTFEICTPSNDPLTDYVQPEDLEWSAQMACALDKLVENNRLTALAYYYRGEPDTLYERIGAALIVGNTLLTSRGIPLAGEADLKTAAAMLIMKQLGGGGSFAELHPFDLSTNAILIGHDGPHNIAISNGRPLLRKLKKYHGKSGCGIGVEFSLKTGPVTLLSISMQGNGRFRLVAAEGVSLPGRIPQTGNTNTRVTFPGMSVTEFCERWCEAGPTHHLALGVGHHVEAIRAFARIMDLDLTVVGPTER